jgi:hypothetical protein
MQANRKSVKHTPHPKGDDSSSEHSIVVGTDARDSICRAIDSTARNGEAVARRRYQRGSVYLNKARTVWLGMYSEYVLDS